MKVFCHFFTFSGAIAAQLFVTTWVCAENLQLQPPTNSPALTGKAPLSLEDIQGPVPLADPINWLLYLAIALGILLCCALCWWFIKKRTKKIVPPSATQVALQKIEDISALKETNPLLYVSQISRITREYTEQRFAISSSQTTVQFFQSVKQNSQISKAYDLEFLKSFFQLFDMAKFAQRAPSKEEVKNIEQAIRDFINTGGDNALS